MLNDDLTPLTPVNFFQIRLDLKHLDEEGLTKTNCSQYILPDTSELCDDEHFADISGGWNSDGLQFFVNVQSPFEDCFYPEVDAGDSVELFVDTRDMKSAGFNTRFCHHFFFLPKPVDHVQKGEITHFRTEDAHPLCDPESLKLAVGLKKNSYTMQISIPRSCLHGYDPSQFERIGFTYRINRPKWQSQHFSVVSEEYQIQNQPSLWASMRLLK